MSTVSNATPLVALSRVGRLELLRDLYVEILIPRAVHEELVVRGQGQAGADSIRSLVAGLRAAGLGVGEAEALALSRETSSTCLTDDQAGIEAARRLGVPIQRTLRVLLNAKNQGLVAHVIPILEALRKSSFWIDDATYERVRKLAGE
jgi:predicted nucleic acid-binding protein